MHGVCFLHAVSPSGLNAKNCEHRRYGILTRSCCQALGLIGKAASPPVGILTLPRNYLIYE